MASSAQIKLERTFQSRSTSIPFPYVGHSIGMAQLEDLGHKMYYFDLLHMEMKLFNEDSSHYKTYTLPKKFKEDFYSNGDYTFKYIDKIEVMGLSQYLFDLDEGVEFLVYIKMYGGSYEAGVYTYIIDDDASLMLKIRAHYTPQTPHLENVTNGTKLFVHKGSHMSQVYSLPGKLPSLRTSPPQKKQVKQASKAKVSPEKEEKKEAKEKLVEKPKYDKIPETLEAGDHISLKNILFNRSSHRLRSSSYQQLEVLLSTLKTHPTMKIRLDGHTDNRGNSDANIELSEKRVEQVKEYLVSNGIEGSRIQIEGYGGTRPIASNKKKETRRLNRRVEMVVLEI